MKKRMKKLFILVLAIAMCLGLTITTQAKSVDPSSLDQATAKAYADILRDQTSQHGIRSSSDYGGIQYAALEDMDADGSPELIVINCEAYNSAYISIWTTKNGKATQTVKSHEVNCGNVVASVYYVRKNGETKVYYRGMSNGRGQAYDWCGYIGADGTIIQDSKEMVMKYDDGWYSVLNEDTTWIKDATPLAEGDGTCWEYNETSSKAVNTLLTSLTDQANKSTQTPPAPTTPTGTYGPYTINNGSYTITFDKAIVEEKVIELRSDWEDFSEFGDGVAYSTYEKCEITLVTIPQGSYITVTNHNPGESIYESTAFVEFVNVDGNNRYTLHLLGAGQAIQTGKVGSTFEWDLSAKAARIDNYLIEISSSTSAPAPSSSTNFTDVSATAYYAAPVTWAIGKGITNGTSANTFSPDNTCTVGEILTFLWRAKGQPEPTIINPFNDIKASDYYYKAAVWAAENGLVEGRTFGASNPCTRSMVVTYLWKLAGSPVASTSTGFTDVSTTASYAAAVSWAISNEITNGEGNNTFSPNKTCTRGQIVTFLYRALA